MVGMIFASCVARPTRIDAFLQINTESQSLRALIDFLCASAYLRSSIDCLMLNWRS
jgi:hypothetical protein